MTTPSIEKHAICGGTAVVWQGFILDRSGFGDIKPGKITISIPYETMFTAVRCLKCGALGPQYFSNGATPERDAVISWNTQQEEV